MMRWAFTKRFSFLLCCFSFALLFSCGGKGLASGADVVSSGKYAKYYDAQFISEVVAELNFARQNPSKYITDVLIPIKENWVGTLYNGRISTNETNKVVDEFIAELQSLTVPLPTISSDIGMTKAAQWLAVDQSLSQATGHKGSDGSSLSNRLGWFGTVGGVWGECCAYGWTSARDAVAWLLIDDGVQGRGHRKIILNNSFTKVGVGRVENGNERYGTIVVIDFAATYNHN